MKKIKIVCFTYDHECELPRTPTRLSVGQKTNPVLYD